MAIDSNASNTPHALLPFLQRQSQGTLTRLYQRPSSCLSIFRLLGPLERQLVMNLLWLEGSVSATTMASWVFKERRRSYDATLKILSNLHIVPTSAIGKLALNTTFKGSMRAAIVAGGSTSSFGVPAPPKTDDKRPSVGIDVLDGYALERWETILHFMVSSNNTTSVGAVPKPSPGVLYLLARSGLMSGTGSSLQITSEGFQFLLHSPHAQLWDLLLQYLGMAEERQMDLVEVLSFLFMLSTMELGREYSTENLSETQKAMLVDLRDYGLVWQRKPSSRRFSPTRLSTTLTSSSAPLPTSVGTGTSTANAGTSTGTIIQKSPDGISTGGATEGYIVLETNYRIYAYTDNPLQTAVLNLFVTLKYRFPNLVVGSITRESVKRALANGITAEQILSYLTTHAHPQMKKNNPLLPVTVQDQIRLWELDRNRLKSDEGYLYTSFASQADYEFVLSYAKQLDVVIWENAAKRCFFGTADGHGRVRGFIERRTGGG